VGGRLGEGESFELEGESVDAALRVPGSDGVAGPCESGLLGRCQYAGFEGALVWGSGGVVAFDDLGADAFAADELLLGAEQVREAVVEVPDLVEDGELGGGVEAEVADEAAHVGPVLPLDVAAVVLVAGSAPGER